MRRVASAELRSSRLRQRRDERGSATLEITVCFPVLLLVIFAVIQGALYYHARDVALAAATDGLTAAQARGGSAAAGRTAAYSFVTRAGGDSVLRGYAVSTSRSGVNATVTVTGRVPSLFPGLPNWSVSQTADGPVERFTQPGEP